MIRMGWTRLLLVAFIFAFLGFGRPLPSADAKGKGAGKGKAEQNVLSEDEGKNPGQNDDSDSTGGKKGKGKQKGKSGKWTPPGLSEKEKAEWVDGSPPGWSKGKKTGWKGGDVPPGFQKWGEARQKRWKEDVESAKMEAGGLIRKRSRDRNRDDQAEKAETASVSLSVEETARAGVPVDKVRELIRTAIEMDMAVEDIERVTRAVAHSTAKGLGAEEVVSYAEKVMDGKVKGEDVAISVYRWMGTQLENKLKGSN